MSVTAAAGFVAVGRARRDPARAEADLALVRSAAPATGAAMWTQNRVQAAPVVVSKRHLAITEPQAVVINSGVANAATGAQGDADAARLPRAPLRCSGSCPSRCSCSRPA